MRYYRSTVVLVLIVLLLSAGMGFAQLKLPRLSPKGKVMQTVGITDVQIVYSRPGVKERQIWGGLVPYNEVWRTGANEATTISFSSDVFVEGNKLSKGEYSLATIPGKETWTVIFNSNTDLWGMFGYDSTSDVLRIDVKPESTENFKERMMFYFTDITDKSASVVLHWEKLKVTFGIQVKTDSLVMAHAKEEVGWQKPYQAAQYALENDLDMEQAKKWLEMALAANENYWTSSLAARFLKKEGKKDEAIKTMEEAISMGKAQDNPPFNLDEMEKKLQEWKKM